jgi:hypothetical protein
MKPILWGAVLGLWWAVFGLPLLPLATVVPLLLKPVTLAFTAGLVARPHLPKVRRWSR